MARGGLQCPFARFSPSWLHPGTAPPVDADGQPRPATGSCHARRAGLRRRKPASQMGQPRHPARPAPPQGVMAARETRRRAFPHPDGGQGPPRAVAPKRQPPVAWPPDCLGMGRKPVCGAANGTRRSSRERGFPPGPPRRSSSGPMGARVGSLVFQPPPGATASSGGMSGGNRRGMGNREFGGAGSSQRGRSRNPPTARAGLRSRKRARRMACRQGCPGFGRPRATAAGPLASAGGAWRIPPGGGRATPAGAGHVPGAVLRDRRHRHAVTVGMAPPFAPRRLPADDRAARAGCTEGQGLHAGHLAGAPRAFHGEAAHPGPPELLVQ